ncbi:hypothetical protein IKE67_02810 [bacterium]|nr:hypothetical protein [bacterium]
MVSFVVSFILTFTTAYLISAVLAKENSLKGFIYINLIAFGQIIFISEFLSTFYKITPLPFLLLNFLLAIIAYIIWYKFGKPQLKPSLKPLLKKIFNACKLDKSLFVLFAGWLFFILVSLILIILLPNTSGDGYCYHIVRSVDWVINQSLAHYETADIRCVSFPINSELLYMWVILFTKKQICLGAFSFVGYLLFLVSTYGIFKHIGYSLRRTLWTLLIISSFASVVVMVSGTETDLIIAGLITASVYLFTSAVKNKSDNISLFMSSMSYALAIGVKAPAIIAIPAIGLLFIIISYKYKDKFSLLKFLGFGLINFIVFSSYNYILNFIDFGNIMGDKGIIIPHKNLWGIKGFFATLIKHFFLLVDFSGIRVPIKFSEALLNIEKNCLQVYNLNEIPEGIYSGDFYFNFSLTEPGMGCGILSFLLILPCWFISLISPIFKKNHLIKIQSIYSLLFLVNFCTLSYLIVFMTFNTRFITTFVLISAPMLVISYIKSNKNFLKILYILIAMLYFTIISTHLWGRPFFRLIKQLKTVSITQLRSDIHCFRFDKRNKELEEWCNINALLDSKFNDKNYKILILPNFAELILYSKTKKLQGFQYDFINAEHLKNINIDKYDVIVYPQSGQYISLFDKYSPQKIDYYLNLENGNFVYYPLDNNSEMLCYYNSLFGTMSKQMGTDNDIPIKKICTFTNKFYEKHPFEITYKTKKHFILLNKNRFAGTK